MSLPTFRHASHWSTNCWMLFSKYFEGCCWEKSWTGCFTWVSDWNWLLLSACFSGPKVWKSQAERFRLYAGCSITFQCMHSTLFLMVFVMWGWNYLHQSFTIAVRGLHPPMNLQCWQLCAPWNWITACWSCLAGCGMWYSIYSRLLHIIPLNSCTNAHNATDALSSYTSNGSWDCMTEYLQLAHTGQVSVKPPS